MSQTQTLDNDSERQIINAVKRAVDLVEMQGLSPNAALEKVAREHKWGADMIRFAGFAYNTGKQTAQRENTDSALGKFASFPLVDPEKVVGSVFPASAEVIKAASAKQPASVEYRLPPQWLARRSSQEKVARFKPDREKAAADAEKTIFSAKTATSVYFEHSRLVKSAEEARTQAGMAYDRLLSSMGKLADYFKQATYNRVKFASVEYAVNVYHGDVGQNLMDWVYTRNKMKEARASDKMPLVEIDREVAPFSLVIRCLKAAEDVNSCRLKEKTAVDKLEEHALSDLAPLVAKPVIIKRATDSLMPESDLSYYNIDDMRHFLPHRLKIKVKEAEAAPVPATIEWTLLADTEKSAGPVASAATGAVTKDLMERAFPGSGERPGDRVNSAYMELEDPAHDAQLRQIRGQALLTDLMNDPSIGSRDPDEVLRGYNEISQLAPRIAMQPIAIRSLLRQHLEGNMAPHEVGQINSLESGVMGSHASVPESLQPIPKAPPAEAPKKATDNYLFDYDVQNSIL